MSVQDERAAAQANKEIEVEDYIVPERSFRESDKLSRKHRHKHKHKHKHHTDPTGMHTGKTKIRKPDGSSSGFVFRGPRRSSKRSKRRKRKKIVKISLIVLSVILAIVIALGATYFILRAIGSNQMHDYDNVEIVIPDENVETQDSGKLISYKGKNYILNENVASIVFVGVDQDTTVSEDAMADAIYIAAIDTKDKRVSVISVSRDTMADVDIYSDEGKFIETEKRQISYAYSFGKDNVQSSENTSAALSKLFFGLPFRNYFSMDMDAILALNDSLGGVTLRSSITFTSPVDGHTISEGSKVTLLGKEADHYIRTRDTGKLDSNNARMDRQQQYISAMLSQIIPTVKRDMSKVSELYDIVKTHSTTSLTMPEMTFIAGEALSSVSKYSDIEYLRIDGEMKEGKYAEFYPDDTALLELMLDVFYSPVE